MKRHCPEEDLMETAENARVAVSSRGLASAASDGFRTLPARETEMIEPDALVAAVVAAVVVAGAGVGAGEDVVMIDVGGADVADSTGVAVTVTVTTLAPPQAASDVVAGGVLAGGVLAGESLAGGALAGGALAGGALFAGALSPKVND
jgi:hypothetical protein